MGKLRRAQSTKHRGMDARRMGLFESPQAPDGLGNCKGMEEVLKGYEHADDLYPGQLGKRNASYIAIPTLLRKKEMSSMVPKCERSFDLQPHSRLIHSLHGFLPSLCVRYLHSFPCFLLPSVALSFHTPGRYDVIFVLYPGTVQRSERKAQRTGTPPQIGWAANFIKVLPFPA